MATPKPGEIRCPTCHRSTPPAAFCTQCGSAIPSDARIRPRGMDRDELQERIRARRSGGGEPYRRGGLADEGASGYQRFEPDPQDAQARRSQRPDERRRDAFDERSASPGGVADDRPDITREADDWQERPSIVPPIAPPIPPVEPVAAAPPPPPIDEPAHVDNYDDAGYDDTAYPYEYDEWDDGRQRRSSGAGAFAILGFLALGVLALLGGAVLAGVFSGDDPGVAEGSPSPSLAASLAPVASETPSTAPSADASADAEPSDQAVASGEPRVFDDGASFEVQACATSEMTFDGCAQEGEFFSGGSFVAWVGFSGASGDDTLLLVLRHDGAAVADSEFVLGNAPFGCTSDCTGYARQGFTGIPPGEYTVELLRNGESAHSVSIGID